MVKINSIPLRSTISIFRKDNQSGFDIYGKPIAGFTKTESKSAIFPYSKSSRDNFKENVGYDTVIYSKEEVLEGDLIYIGEFTDVVSRVWDNLTTWDELLTWSFQTSNYKMYEVKDVKEMKRAGQETVGYKIWL